MRNKATLGVVFLPWENFVLWYRGKSVLMTSVAKEKRKNRKVHHVLPILSAISAARSPQMPLTAVKTLSPASTALKMAHSIAVWPVPLTAKVIVFRVWNKYWIPSLMSFITWHEKWTNVDRKFLWTPLTCCKKITFFIFSIYLVWICWFVLIVRDYSQTNLGFNPLLYNLNQVIKSFNMKNLKWPYCSFT